MKSPKQVLKMMGLALVLSFVAVSAAAQCSNFLPPKGQPSLRPQSWNGQGHFQPASLFDGEDVDPIVGLWVVDFNVGDNRLDHAIVQWHSDHTEIMNSSRPPASQSFCLGVWKRTGARSYKLNHFAVSWDPNNLSGPVGPANIIETVTLSSDGTTFSGNFDLTQYDTSGNVIVHFAGTIAGKRLTVSSGIGDVL